MAARLPSKEIKRWPAWKVTTKRVAWEKMTPTMQEAFLAVCRARRAYPGHKIAPRTLGALRRRRLVMSLSDGSLIPTYPGLELWGYVLCWR